MSSISDKQIDFFIGNMNEFLDLTKHIINETFENYPGVDKKNSLSITPDLIDGIVLILSFCDKNKKSEILIQAFEKIYPFWKDIYDENDSFLIEHINSLFPENGYAKDICFFFGANSEAKKYVTDPEILEDLWNLLKGMYKVSLKYIYYSNHSIKNKIVDFDKQISIWKIQL